MSEALRDILLHDEVVEHEYELEQGTSLPRLTVTNLRCILWRPQLDVVSEFDKRHLSSIDYVLSDFWIVGVILIAIGLLGGTILVSVFSDDMWIGFLISVVLVVGGTILLFRQERVTFWITGRKEPINVTQKIWLWQSQKKRLRYLLTVARRIGGVGHPDGRLD